MPCVHYSQLCSVKSKCCDEFYSCFRCHDLYHEAKRIDHRFDRRNLHQVKCDVCHEIQDPSNKCVKCEIEFAIYSCLKCALFTNVVDGVTFNHCDDCGLCLKEDGMKSIHCFECGFCVVDSSVLPEAERKQYEEMHEKMHKESILHLIPSVICVTQPSSIHKYHICHVSIVMFTCTVSVI